MRETLKAAFAAEMAMAAEARRSQDFNRAFWHLARAHILSQRHTWPHVRSHIAMLAIGWQRQDWREIVGQIMRIAAALIFSRIWVPLGNTGGANVNPLKPMPIPEDLRALLLDTRDQG